MDGCGAHLHSCYIIRVIIAHGGVSLYCLQSVKEGRKMLFAGAVHCHPVLPATAQLLWHPNHWCKGILLVIRANPVGHWLQVKTMVPSNLSLFNSLDLLQILLSVQEFQGLLVDRPQTPEGLRCPLRESL
jgi:hypothetical protein